MNITPDMINWREGLVFGFRKEMIEYPSLAAPQRIGAGRKRRFLRFVLTERDARKTINEIHSELTNEFTVIVPIFPIRPINRGTTNYQGETTLHVKGNIYKRPLTVYSSLQNGWPNSTYTGYETLVLYNSSTKEIEEVNIKRAGAYRGGIEYAENGSPFSYSIIELEDPIAMTVQEKHLFIYNFFKARLAEELETDQVNERIAEMELEFEQVYEGEMA